MARSQVPKWHQHPHLLEQTATHFSAQLLKAARTVIALMARKAQVAISPQPEVECPVRMGQAAKAVRLLWLKALPRTRQ